MHVNKCQFVFLSMYILPLGLDLPIERRHCGRKFSKTMRQKEKMPDIFLDVCKEGPVHSLALLFFTSQTEF